RSRFVALSKESNRSAMVIRSRSSASNLPFTPNEVLVRGQLAQPHRSARVQLLRRDPDLGTESELFAVGETRARVHDHRGGIDLRGEPPCRFELASEDRLGMAR